LAPALWPGDRIGARDAQSHKNSAHRARLETGKFDPSLPLAFAIARLFEKPIEEIFIDMDHQTDKTLKATKP